MKQKWGRMLHPNAGSHPHAGLAPQKMNYKEEENKYIFQSREGMDGTLVCSNFAKICSVEILIFFKYFEHNWVLRPSIIQCSIEVLMTVNVFNDPKSLSQWCIYYNQSTVLESDVLWSNVDHRWT